MLVIHKARSNRRNLFKPISIIFPTENKSINKSSPDSTISQTETDAESTLDLVTSLPGLWLDLSDTLQHDWGDILRRGCKGKK
jgi:hypothetical protein